MSLSVIFNAIGWCHFTINFWWGCTEVSPACLHCYAKKFAAYAGRRLFGRPVLWGKGEMRAERLERAREECLKLDRKAKKQGVRFRVFLNSMSDTLDEEVPAAWLAELLRAIHDCPHLDFLILTKRPENWQARINAVSGCYDLTTESGKAAWAAGARWYIQGEPPTNVWIGTTVEDQTRADERIPHLLKIPAKVRFLSCEPLLGPVKFPTSQWLCPYGGPKIDWVIAGGESGGQARPSHPDWFRSLRDQCQTASIPFYFKQWGEFIPVGEATAEPLPERLKGHRFDDGTLMLRAGTARAGASIDGREWREFPAS